MQKPSVLLASVVADSVHERQIDMTTAKIYWRQALLGYKIEKPMNLSADRKPSSDGIQTGRGFSVEIHFDNHIVEQIINYASRFDVTLYQVFLTIYYIFLFKLTGGQRDLIVATVRANRYRPELDRIIGMFANTLPMRVHIDPQDTFEQLLRRVSDMIFEVQPHSNLPYQYIIEQLPMRRLHQQNLIQTMFTLDERPTTLVRLDQASIMESWSVSHSKDNNVQIGNPISSMAMFDMTVSMEYVVETHSLRAELAASSDLFDATTVVNMARRFHLAVEQLFSPFPMDMTATEQSIYDLSLILPEEMTNDVQCMKFHSMSEPNSIARASFAQTRVWLDEGISSDPQVAKNNMPFLYRLAEGSLSIERLRRALRLVVLKHSSLRTSLFFDSTADCLMQSVVQTRDDDDELFIFIESTLKSDTDLKAIMLNERCNPSNFDLSNGRVFRVHAIEYQSDNNDLLQTGDCLLFNFHPSAFDIPSFDVFHHDLCMAYESGTTLPWNDNDLRYIDYAVAEYNTLMKVDSAFWHEMMFDYNWNHFLDLPIDHQRKSNEQQTGRAYTANFKFDDDLTKALIYYASATEIPLLTISLTCYYVFLFKLAKGETDLCVGMDVNTRHRPELKHIVGTFVNLIPLRFQLDPMTNFESCLRRVAKLYHQSCQHAHFPFQRILEAFSLPSATHLNIAFNFHTNDGDEHTIDNIKLGAAQLQQLLPLPTNNSSHDESEIVSQFDLTVTINYDQSSSTLGCILGGSCDLFNLTTVLTLADRFHLLCRQIFCSSFDRKHQPIYELSILLPVEKEILQKLNNCATTTNVTDCIHQAFAQQATMHPNKVAVTLDGQSLTYGQLLGLVQQLAFVLINEKGVQSGDIVCQCVDRSIEMVVGIMGIMMSGGVYAPLSPSDPIDRLDSLVHQVNAKLVLVNQMSLPYVSQLNVPIVDISEIIKSSNALNDEQIEQLSAVAVTPESIAHIMFTSGSTGTPKAVQIRHRNFMGYMNTQFTQTNDIMLQLTSPSFDVHVDEIDGALVRGAHLVMLKIGYHLDFDYLTKVIYHNNVTFIFPVPSWMNALSNFLSENVHAQDRVKQVRWWYLGGEQLLSSTVRQILPFVGEQCHIVNGYGPSEITETATRYDVRREELSTITSIPIGSPLVGYRIYLLDEYRQLVVPGQQGEIVVGGVGVFAGYYGRADLTSRVIIDIDGEQCYVTGDVARLDVKSGELIFIGRRDFQVKLRGQRIELSAIEWVILGSSSNIVNCVVAKEDSQDDSYLAAYIQVRENNEKDALQEEIVRVCRSHLSSYMVPSKWLLVSEFPLNANGKVDRKKLQQMAESVGLPAQQQTTMILSLLETKLQDIFIRAFHLKSSPDVETSFGQLGGTSLGAMRALNLIRQEICEKMDIGLLFANPSVRQLAIGLELLLSNVESDQEKRKQDDHDFSIRPCSSWLIETLGILLLTCQWLWPTLVATRLPFFPLQIVFVPLMHLLQFPVCIKLFGGPFKRGRDTLYSWRYYCLWFLRRQWSLNTYWLTHLLGTPFYNAYLRLCGSCISDGVHIYTTHIDAPWLLKIGNGTYIGHEVVFSSLTYHDRIYELHEIRIGSHCSIGTRCVLHDRVDMHDRVFVEPLTAVTGRIFGAQGEASSPCTFNRRQTFFQLVAVFTMAIMHALVFKLSWAGVYWLPLYLSLPLCWLLWSVLGAGIGLLLLRFIVVGKVQPNFSYPLNSWEFLSRFWLRHIIISSFGPCMSTVFDEFSSFAPLILRWLGATIEPNDIQIADFVPLLRVPPNLLTIEHGVTTASDVCFLPYDVTINGQCVVTGPIQIGHGSFLGNNSVLRSDVCLPSDVLVGSLTRVDSTISSTKKGDILLGVPARAMPFVVSEADRSDTSTTIEQITTLSIIDDFQQILMDFVNILLLVICLSPALMMISSFSLFSLVVLMVSLLVYSFIVSVTYALLMNAKFNHTGNNQPIDEIKIKWQTTFAMTLFIQYGKWVGCLLGGTQWLVIVLRQFGMQIGDDVIIDDINTVYDVHLMTIGSHTRLSSTALIQCHTFEGRQLKLRPVTIGPSCILKPMTVVLAGVTFVGHNHLAPCSLALPHDRLAAYSDWSGSPTKRSLNHHGSAPPQRILAERQSSLGTYNVAVGRFDDDVLILYFGHNGWLDWQTGIDLRRPFRPFDIYIKLFFVPFLCKPQAKRVLILGLGGGILPLLIRHYFPSIVIDAVEIDETVIELARDYFDLAEQMTDGCMNVIADDGFHYVSETTHRYDVIFTDAFVEEAMPDHMNTCQFFTNLRGILNNDGCLATNANLPTTEAFDRLLQAFSSTFQENILLAHTNINVMESARVIISGNRSSLASISSSAQAVQKAERLQSDVRLEFDLAHLVSLAYRGQLINTASNN